MSILCVLLWGLAGREPAVFAEPASTGAGAPGNVATGQYYFSQKGGMLPQGGQSIYIRTNDEFTGFSTFMVGYRLGISDRFQLALEAGAGIGVYLVNLLTYTKIYETKNGFFFLGLRTRTGLKQQDTYLEIGSATLDDRRFGIYAAADLTAAFRLGKTKRWVVYYSLYPFFDIDLSGNAANPVEIYFSPVHIGFEFAFRKNPHWTFAVESGYFFALNDVPQTSWFNFPNLANVGFYYRF